MLEIPRSLSLSPSPTMALNQCHAINVRIYTYIYVYSLEWIEFEWILNTEHRTLHIQANKRKMNEIQNVTKFCKILWFFANGQWPEVRNENILLSILKPVHFSFRFFMLRMAWMWWNNANASANFKQMVCVCFNFFFFAILSLFDGTKLIHNCYWILNLPTKCSSIIMYTSINPYLWINECHKYRMFHVQISHHTAPFHMESKIELVHFLFGYLQI